MKTDGEQFSVLVAHPSADLYGSDRVLLESIDGLRRSGARVLVALPSSGPLVAELERRGAAVILSPTPVLRKSLLTAPGMVKLAASSVYGLLRSVGVIRGARPDVILANTITVPLWTAAGRLTGVPVVTHVHEAEATAPRALRAALALPLLLSRGILTNSQFSSATLAAALPALRGRSTVLYNGVPGACGARAAPAGPARWAPHPVRRTAVPPQGGGCGHRRVTAPAPRRRGGPAVGGWCGLPRLRGLRGGPPQQGSGPRRRRPCHVSWLPKRGLAVPCGSRRRAWCPPGSTSRSAIRPSKRFWPPGPSSSATPRACGKRRPVTVRCSSSNPATPLNWPTRWPVSPASGRTTSQAPGSTPSKRAAGTVRNATALLWPGIWPRPRAGCREQRLPGMRPRAARRPRHQPKQHAESGGASGRCWPGRVSRCSAPWCWPGSWGRKATESSRLPRCTSAWWHCCWTRDSPRPSSSVRT